MRAVAASTVIILSLVFNLSCASSRVTPQGVGERYQGRIAAIVPGASATAFVTLQIDRYADEQELRELAQALREGGQDAMVELIESKESAGWMRIGSGLRYHLRVVREVRRADGGRIVVALTERPIQYGEIRRGARSQNYPLGMVDLVLDASGHGSGRLVPAAQVRFAAGTAELVSYLSQPYALRDVERLF